jgi:AraC-like DNA-binding protein
MLYLERRPDPALAPFIKSFWYACDPEATHRHEHLLPNGHAQIVISLARDCLTDANHPTDPLQHSPATVLRGIYFHHPQIDAIDLSELIGILFHPGGTTPFFPENTQHFTNCETDLTTLWCRAAQNLRNDLHEAPTQQRNSISSTSLSATASAKAKPSADPNHRLRPDSPPTIPGTTTIAALTRDIGIGPRRLSQLFREQIGVSPKLYCRIQRFQQAVQLSTAAQTSTRLNSP